MDLGINGFGVHYSTEGRDRNFWAYFLDGYQRASDSPALLEETVSILLIGR